MAAVFQRSATSEIYGLLLSSRSTQAIEFTDDPQSTKKSFKPAFIRQMHFE